MLNPTKEGAYRTSAMVYRLKRTSSSGSGRFSRWRPPADRRQSGQRLRNTLVATIALLLLAGLVTVGGVLTTRPHKQPSTRHAAPAAIASTSTTTAVASPAVCPLTGAPVPGGGSVPARPALAVKVDNYQQARPQSGLAQADIVFEEPVEGRITRYVAVYQCQGAPMVGPIRSARNLDIGILGEFGQPLFVHVGGIDPVLANIEASPLTNLDLGDYPSIWQHVPGRVAPYDTYATTAALWGMRPNDTTPPAPVFSYSETPPMGPQKSIITIPFSQEADVVWRYDASQHLYLRYYGSAPDEASPDVQESATNVIVQFVHVTYGPWVEDSNGALEVQANLYQDASGPAEVFRNGVEISGAWSRSSLAERTEFTVDGAPITLAPGRTWVELVPSTISVTSVEPSTISSGGPFTGTP